MDKKEFKKKVKNQLIRYLNCIHKEYQITKKVFVKNRVANYVFRGRGRNISSFSEDKFATLLWRIIKSKKINIFVDQGISIVGEKQTYYPDIVVVKKLDNAEFEILYMIDLKTDIGWFRNSSFDHPNTLKSICKRMKHKKLKFNISNEDSNKKKSKTLTLNNDASYDMVIISSRNSGKYEQKLIKWSNDKNKNLWVLSKGNHPNHSDDSHKMEPNTKAWFTIINRILNVVNKNL